MDSLGTKKMGQNGWITFAKALFFALENLPDCGDVILVKFYREIQASKNTLRPLHNTTNFPGVCHGNYEITNYFMAAILQ